MALFGLFGKKDPAAEAKKLVAKATQKFGPKENRQEALEKLRDLDAPEGWAGLLQRFTIRVEPGIVDDEEKAFVCDALVDGGEAAKGPVRDFITKNEHVSWPLRALGRMVPPAELVETILAALDREGPEYTRDPEKKITLVRYLEAHEDVPYSERLVPYFEDASEDVRFSAVSAAIRQPVEALREPLIRALVTAHEEKSERMRRHCAEALVKTGFAVKGHTPSVQAALPAGFTVDKDGVVRAK
jgi:HEAT repeat protein